MDKYDLPEHLLNLYHRNAFFNKLCRQSAYEGVPYVKMLEEAVETLTQNQEDAQRWAVRCKYLENTHNGASDLDSAVTYASKNLPSTKTVQIVIADEGSVCVYLCDKDGDHDLILADGPAKAIMRAVNLANGLTPPPQTAHTERLNDNEQGRSHE